MASNYQSRWLEQREGPQEVAVSLARHPTCAVLLRGGADPGEGVAVVEEVGFFLGRSGGRGPIP